MEQTIIGIIIGAIIMLVIIGIIVLNLINPSAPKDEIAKFKNNYPSDGNISEVMNLTIKNITELHGYFVFSKQQSKTVYYTALLISVLGFIFFIIGIFLPVIVKENTASKDVISYLPTIGGAIVEIIAGTFFWLHSSVTKQMDRFFMSLTETQRLLIAIGLVEKIESDKKGDSYNSIISKIFELNNNNSKP